MASTDGLIERLTTILNEQATRIEAKMKASDAPMSTWEMKSLTDTMHALVAVKKVAKDESPDPQIVELWELAKVIEGYGMTPREAMVLIRHAIEDDSRGART